jgi:hypothetical protein
VAKEHADPVRPLRSTFHVGDAFPQNDPRSALALLFIMASLELEAKARSASLGSEGCDDRERFAILGMIGAAKEAMDAFRVADSLGCFKRAGSVEKVLELARHESNAVVAGSLYQIVQRVRNQGSNHWDRDRIQAALTELQGDILPLYGEGRDGTIPLVGAITSKVLEVFGITAPGIFPRLLELAEAMGRLGRVLYTHHTQGSAKERSA